MIDTGEKWGWPRCKGVDIARPLAEAFALSPTRQQRRWGSNLLGRSSLARPAWAPNGRFILFGLDPPGSLAVVTDAPANGLYVIRADGTDLTPLLVSDEWKREPDWVASG